MSINLRQALCLVLMLSCAPTMRAVAHGDPEMEETRVLTVTVTKDPKSGDLSLSSQPFRLVVPSNTVEILWRVDSGQKDSITFSLLSGDRVLAAGLRNESKSRIPKADNLTIGNVSGSEKPFLIEIYVHTVTWHH
jgi:hypothetical protein